MSRIKRTKLTPSLRLIAICMLATALHGLLASPASAQLPAASLVAAGGAVVDVTTFRGAAHGRGIDTIAATTVLTRGGAAPLLSGDNSRVDDVSPVISLPSTGQGPSGNDGREAFGVLLMGGVIAAAVIGLWTQHGSRRPPEE